MGRFSAGLLTMLLVFRIAYVLSANPIGEFASELLYLRFRELRPAGWTLLIALMLEVAQAFLPFMTRRGYVAPLKDVPVFLDLAQILLVLVATTVVTLVVSRYTHRALDRRIRESMETLAYLEGQRRRRRSAERDEWERSDADEE